jgi:carboxylesterase type B
MNLRSIAVQGGFLSLFCLEVLAGEAPTATIDAGIVIGTAVNLPTATAAVNQFLGIPFAQSPPVRFTPPAPVKPWDSPLMATAWKPACVQEFQCKSRFSMRIYRTAA